MPRELRTVAQLADSHRKALLDLNKRGSLRMTGLTVVESFSETGNPRLVDGFPVKLTANIGIKDTPLIMSFDATVQGMGRPVCQLPHAEERYGKYAYANLYENDWHARNLAELFRQGKAGTHAKLHCFIDETSTVLEFLVSVNDNPLFTVRTKNATMQVLGKVSAEQMVGKGCLKEITTAIVSPENKWAEFLIGAIQELNAA